MSKSDGNGSYRPKHYFHAGADQRWYEPARAKQAPPNWDRALTTALRISKAGSRRLYARQQLRTFHLGALALLTCVLAIGPSSDEALTNPQLARAMAAAVTAAGCLSCLRLMHRALVIDGDRVTVRNMLRTRHITAAEVLRFEPPAFYGRYLHIGLRIVLTDGRSVWANAFSATRVDLDTLGVRECAELNAWLDDVRAGIALPVPERPARSRPLTWLWRCWLVFLVAFLALALALSVAQIVDPSYTL